MIYKRSQNLKKVINYQKVKYKKKNLQTAILTQNYLNIVKYYMHDIY